MVHEINAIQIDQVWQLWRASVKENSVLETAYLKFTPQFTLFTADTIHDARYVSEMSSEFFFQFLRFFAASEHRLLIKMLGKRAKENRKTNVTHMASLSKLNLQKNK